MAWLSKNRTESLKVWKSKTNFANSYNYVTTTVKSSKWLKTKCKNSKRYNRYNRIKVVYLQAISIIDTEYCITSIFSSFVILCCNQSEARIN